MKHLYKIGLCVIASFIATSCADVDPLTFSVAKPESIAIQEEINGYGALKTYVNKQANPKFKLGAGISLSEYTSKGVMYRLINSNFDEVTPGYEMKHGAVVQEDGSILLGNVEGLLEETSKVGLTVYGHTLVWHANQNAEYLNSLIAPEVSSGPSWEVVTEADFETDDASNYQSNANAVLSFTADGEGKGGEGRALKIVNSEVRTNDWDSQFFITFSPAMQAGEKYRLSMDVRADAAASFTTQAHVVPYQYKHWDFFGAINATTEWSTFEKELTISDLVAGTGALAYNLGHNATSYYFDNITLTKYNESGGGGPALEPSVITNTDFESSDAGWGGWGNGSTRGRSAQGEGYDGTGYAYTFTNPSATNFWEAQIAYDFVSLQMESTYVLNFRVKSNTSGTIRAEIQSTADYSSDPFGSFEITPDWKEYTLQTTATKADRNRFLISFGDFAGTVYVDNVTLSRVNPDGAGNEKTPEEKKQIIDSELERWIAGMLEVSKPYVKAWDVVNEPMDDGNPYELKTGIGRELAEDEFYWQDYLGKDYAVRAFELARQYGNPDDILFINDYNLEYNLDKCRGLIDYVEYIESQGATVNGIGTQMHISIDSDKEKIVEMLTLLAATGKMIKISEFDLGVGVPTSAATTEHYQAQAEMYKFVIEKYFEIIPASQRYGITFWSPIDSPPSSSWRPDEPIGLWNQSYTRKRAYAAAAEAIEQ